MWDCYCAVLTALENHIIDTSHDPHSKNKTTFYFRDCCGGDIVNEALKYLTNKTK